MPEPPAAHAIPPPKPLAVACLIAGLLVFVTTFGTLTVRRYQLNIATWDLAIFDQACWLLAHGEGGFLTTRNMPIFAHHLNLWLLPLALLYRVAPGPETLLWVQTLAAALAAIPIFALARRLTRSDAVATIWAWLYLSYPPLGRMLMHDFHFEPLALPCFVTAILFAHQERWRAMGIWLALAAFAKEDVGLAIAGFGLGLAFSGTSERTHHGGTPSAGSGQAPARREDTQTAAETHSTSRSPCLRASVVSCLSSQRKVGLLTACAGLGYTLVAMKLIMPRFAVGEGEAFYTDLFFSHLGDSLPAVALSPILRPGAFFGSLFGPGNGALLVALLAPVAGLSLLRPAWLAGGLPTLLLNMVSGFFVTHSTDYHYQGFVLPFVVCAAVGGGAWLSERLEAQGVARAAALATPVTMAAIGIYLLPLLVPLQVPPPISSPLRMGKHLRSWELDRAWAPAFEQAIAEIPPDASVSASMVLLPKLSGRQSAWYFPSPFVMLIPGFETEADFDRADLAERLGQQAVDYIAVRVRPGPPLSESQHDRILAALDEAPEYERVLDLPEVRLYRRR